MAIIDNSQRDDLLLNDDKISLAIADEILAAATEQVDGAMSGRTREGVAREIRFHCKYGFLTKSEKITIADMGGTDKSRTDYDYNAKGLENFFNIPAVLWEMLKKYVF